MSGNFAGRRQIQTGERVHYKKVIGTIDTTLMKVSRDPPWLR
jgi:hypothetical protein